MGVNKSPIKERPKELIAESVAASLGRLQRVLGFLFFLSFRFSANVSLLLLFFLLLGRAWEGHGFS